MRGSFIALALCALVIAAQGAELLGRSHHKNHKKRKHHDNDHDSPERSHSHDRDHGKTHHGNKNKHKDEPSSASSCELDIRMDFSISSPPLVLVQNDDNEWTLAEPTRRTKSNSFMNLSNKKIKLACPGEGNSLSQIGSATAEATCSASSGQAAFIVDGKSIPVGDVTCRNRITPYEQPTGNSCKGDGTEFAIGFTVEEKMYSLITSCLRVKDGKSYYSQHVLDGQHFPERGNGGSRKESRPQFSYYNKMLFRGFNPNSAYVHRNELQSLSDAMGGAANSVFGQDDRFFARGHFCPNADFIMDTWRDATFTYVNAQPQWQQVNGGNWNNVETYVRYHAAAVKNTLNVITGATGTLAPSGNKLFLASNNRIPVPENYVKLVQDPRTNQCIGFVGNNFDTSYASPAKCSLSCEDYGWPKFTNTEKEGIISCCTAQDIVSSYSEALPDHVFDCSGGVLKYQS